MGRREEKRSCCTWPRILALVVLLIAGAICVWYFVPWDYTINKVLDDVEIPFGNSDESTDDGVPPLKDNDAIPNTRKPQPVVTPSPTLSPTKPPDYEFMRCNSGNAGECCNGQEGICDLRLNEALFATLHNGMATFEDGFLFGPNHKYKLEGALDRGYRGLNLDICNCGGEIMFCHGICALGPRDVVDVMESVNTFLDENPTEIIVFIYQVDSNVDQDVDLNVFYEKLLMVDGLVDKMYVHQGPNTPWPTLGQLTASDFRKQIVMFHYNGPDCDADPGACPDGLHQYTFYASDNDWEHLDIASIEDRLSSCELRLNGRNQKIFVGLNNFVSPPSQSSAQNLNDYASALSYIETCSQLIGTDINFLLVDFWSEGDVPHVAQDRNAAIAAQRQTRERKLLR